MLEMTYKLQFTNMEQLYYQFHLLKVFAYISIKTTLNYIGITAAIFNKDVLQKITEDQQSMNVSLNLITKLQDQEAILFLKLFESTKFKQV